jgi:hypothetical protein
MWAILALGILGFILIIERSIYLFRKGTFNSDKFMSEVFKAVSTGNVESAMKICDAASSMALPKIIRAGLVESDNGTEKIQNASTKKHNANSKADPIWYLATVEMWPRF